MNIAFIFPRYFRIIRLKILLSSIFLSNSCFAVSTVAAELERLAKDDCFPSDVTSSSIDALSSSSPMFEGVLDEMSDIVGCFLLRFLGIVGIGTPCTIVLDTGEFCTKVYDLLDSDGCFLSIIFGIGIVETPCTIVLDTGAFPFKSFCTKVYDLVDSNDCFLSGSCIVCVFHKE